jgi:hypothetical protein
LIAAAPAAFVFASLKRTPIASAMAAHRPKPQFKPGISGNPKGRNKKAPRFSGVIEQVLDEKIELRVGNRVRRQRESTTEPNAQLHSALHPEHRS